jgi:hypothetical protein
MKLRAIAAALLIGLPAVSAAEAMPVAPVEHGQLNKAVLIDYACGRGFHITPWGDCRPNWRRPPPPRPRYVYRERRYGWDRPPPPWAYRHYRRDWDRPRW